MSFETISALLAEGATIIIAIWYAHRLKSQRYAVEKRNSYLEEKVSRQSAELARLQTVILEGRAHDARMVRDCQKLRVQLNDERVRLNGEIDKMKRAASLITVDVRFETMEKMYRQRETELQKEIRDLTGRIERLCSPKRDKSGKFAKKR